MSTSIYDINLKKWLSFRDFIRSNSALLKKDSHDFNVDLEYVATAFCDEKNDNNNEAKSRLRESIEHLKNLKQGLSSSSKVSGEVKTQLGEFIVFCENTIYKDPKKARQSLRKMGLLPNPVVTFFKNFYSQRILPRVKKFTYKRGGKGNSGDGQDKRYSYYRDSEKPSFLQGVNGVFEKIRSILDFVLDNQGLIIIGVVGLMAVLCVGVIIVTFATGQWIEGIIEIALLIAGYWLFFLIAAVVNYSIVVIIRVLQALFYRWWSFCLAIIIIVGIFMFPILKKEFVLYQKYRYCIEQAEDCAKNQKYLSASSLYIEASDYSKRHKEEFVETSEIMKQKADSFSNVLLENIPKHISAAKKIGRQDSSLVNAVYSIDVEIDLLKHNTADSIKIKQIERNFKKLKKQKRITD